MTSASIAFMPLPNNLIGLYILKVISCVTLIPTLYTPYTVDYVQKGSLGLMTGYYNVINSGASIVATSVSIQVQKKYPAAYVYYAIGSFSFCIAVFLGFGLKDVHQM